MEKSLYKVIFEGKIQEDADPGTVKTRLQALFQTDAAVIEHLFRGTPTVLKHNLSRQYALKYKQAIEKTGAVCRIVPQKHPSAPPGAPKTASDRPSRPPRKKPMQTCPKCGFTQPVGWAECCRCGVLFKRVASPAKSNASSQRSPRKARHHTDASIPDVSLEPQPIEREGWMALGGGAIITLVVLFLPFFTYILGYIKVLVHEFGHTVVGWLFGYPSIPAFDFRYGGGITAHQPRNLLLLILVYVGLGYVFYLFRRNRLALIVWAGIVGGYTLFAFTSGHEILNLWMGHGFELLFAGIFFYRAISGSAVLIAVERPLYAFLGFFITVLDLRFAYRLMTSHAYRVDYEAAKGGGHWMDFSRIAEEYLHVDLTAVATFFFICCLLPPVLAVLAYRYKAYWASGLARLLALHENV
ncbi:hypothetical protein GF339_16020 [candidate division KSB3 bacterium]|uniref:Uncharacterized protein n=1 Tax=candidate division KSB3 bacterium TaxID=2044937 RepID=A0A9D5JXK6_9BACT|nr:hypothetical protein [candidate division KSB3 bacterium]MBD3326093.1 hypothetical protein [candidate division KSB3 bacterium]